jgi:hypothetical protein
MRSSWCILNCADRFTVTTAFLVQAQSLARPEKTTAMRVLAALPQEVLAVSVGIAL